MNNKKQSSLDKFRAAAAEREKQAKKLEDEMKKRHTQGKEDMSGAIDRLAQRLNKEDAVVNSVGGGQIAGLGVGSQGEPGVNPKKKKLVVPFKTFKRNNPVM